ncbi:MAG: hypothetical protein Q9213_000399 [Squamulea squamosa]
MILRSRGQCPVFTDSGAYHGLNLPIQTADKRVAALTCHQHSLVLDEGVLTPTTPPAVEPRRLLLDSKTADDVTRELRRITSQIVEIPKKGHYALDTTKTRLKDLSCLYFPAGFHVQYGLQKLVCGTLGHFVAIQFRAYVARLVWETRAEEDSAFKRRYIDPRIDFNDEHKTNLTNEAKGWNRLRERWMSRSCAPRSDEKSDAYNLPDSAVVATEALVRRMGVQEIHNQRSGSVDNCTELRDPAGEVYLPMLIAEYGSDMVSDCGSVMSDECSSTEDDTLSNLP